MPPAGYKLVGEVHTETGLLVIGPPEAIFKQRRGEEEGTLRAIRYDDFVDAIGGDPHLQLHDGIRGTRRTYPFAVAVGTGADGSSKVYLKRDKNGNPQRILIDLDG
eukprot:tig00000492_g1545.t1